MNVCFSFIKEKAKNKKQSFLGYRFEWIATVFSLFCHPTYLFISSIWPTKMDLIDLDDFDQEMAFMKE